MNGCHRPTGDGPLAEELGQLYRCLYDCREDGCGLDDRWIAAVERRLEERFGPEAVREEWSRQLVRGAA